MAQFGLRASEVVKNIASNSWFYSILLISLLIRLLLSWNGGYNLFVSGPDAPAYLGISQEFIEKGFFASDINQLPGYAFGYPLLLSVFRWIFEDNWWLFVNIFQNALFIASSIYARKVVFELANKFMANITFASMVLAPSFLYLTLEIMYESIVAAGLIFWTFSTVRLVSNKLTTFESFFLAFTNFTTVLLQPKLFPIMLISFSAIYLRFPYSRARTLVFSLVTSLSISVILIRNWFAYGIIALSTNFGTAMIVGFEDRNIPIQAQNRVGQGVEYGYQFDKQVVGSALRYYLDNPYYFVSHFAKQISQLFGPLNGAGIGGGRASTWFHGLDPARIYSGLSETPNMNYLYGIQRGFMLTTLLFSIFGLKSLLQLKAPRTHRVLAWHLFLPICFFVVIHGISDGDARYRLPVMPLLTTLAIFGLCSFTQRFRKVQTTS